VFNFGDEKADTADIYAKTLPAGARSGCEKCRIRGFYGKKRAERTGYLKEIIGRRCSSRGWNINSTATLSKNQVIVYTPDCTCQAPFIPTCG